jgi:predicted AAA+ superfamily ATPase
MIHRTLLDSLLSWKEAHERRPLVIRGARQVGKSFLVRAFGKSEFTHFLEINFEQQPELKSLFRDLDAVRISRELSQFSNVPVIPGKTLIFFDELQECPNALRALRYFYEQLPDLHVIGAGSLLDFLLSESSEELRIPVGRIEYRYLHPLSFKEFLTATGNTGILAALSSLTLSSTLAEPLHQKALSLVEQYLHVGGMPAAVSAFVHNQESTRYREIQAAIIQTYRDDFRKYSSKIDIDILEAVYRRLPLFATKHFKYSELYQDTQSRTLKKVLDLFEKARLISKVYASSGNGIPLDAEIDVDDYKFSLIDIGLFAQLLQVPLQPLSLWDQPYVNAGGLAEQFVAQELLALAPSYQEPRLYYWRKNKPRSQAEVDYLFAESGVVYPIEVKSGTTGRLKSMRMFIEQKKSPFGVRLSPQPLSFYDHVLSVPLYAISELPRLIDVAGKNTDRSATSHN